jgi:hypothetical protein
LPAATSSSAATVTVAGALTGVAPAVTADLSGNLNNNYLDSVLPAATASMAGALTVSGAVSATIPAAVGALAGEVEIPANDITITPGTLTSSWTPVGPGRSWGSGAAGRAWKTGTPTT